MISAHVDVQYSEGFKSEIAEYARLLGQRATSRLFSISQRRVFDWLNHSTKSSSSIDRKSEEALMSTNSVPDEEKCEPRPSSSGNVELSVRSTKQLLDLGVEKDVYDWVKQQYPQKVSSTEVRAKAKGLYRVAGHTSMKCSYGWYRRWAARFQMTKSNLHDDTDPLILTWLLKKYDDNQIISYSDLQSYAQKTLSLIKPGFEASGGWATRFLKRHHVIINWDGIYEDPLPNELEKEVEVFRSRIQEMCIPQYFTEKLGSIGCMDEVPLSFSRSREDNCGASRVKKSSVTNCEATVLLTLMADGTLEPPFVIMKAQDSNTINQVYSKQDSPVVLFYCKSTEPTMTSLKKWFELIWIKKIPSGLLFLDSYNLHKQFKEKTESLETSIELLPLGTSCKLQPINYLARRRFLKCMEDFWMNHVKNGSSDAEVQLPSTDTIVEWVTASYKTVREQKVALSDSFQRVQLIPT